MSTPNSGLSIAQQMVADGSLPDAVPAQTSAAQSGQSIAQQMLSDGSLPDMPENPYRVPMRAVVTAVSATSPDAEAKTQQLAQRAGMGIDLTRANPQAAQQRAASLDLERRALEFTNPVLARQLADPNFAAVAHDDLDSLSAIEQGAAAMRLPTLTEQLAWNQNHVLALSGLTPSQRQAVSAERARVASAPHGLLDEAEQFAANTNTAVFGAMKPFLDTAGYVAESALESGSTVEPDASAWMKPADQYKVPRLTTAIQNWLSRGIKQGPQAYLTDPVTGRLFPNPDYRWYGRNLANTIEQVPGQFAAYAAGTELAGLGAEASAAEESIARSVQGRITPATESMAEAVRARSIPAMLGTQAAQTTYAQARAKGADQKTAVMTALASGLFNYATMGEMPGAPPASSIAGAVGQWATRSAAMGTGLAVGDNAIARFYDPDRSLVEGLPQSIATMAAFEGVGAMGHIIDAVKSSKLRTRQPAAFQQHVDATFEGDPSVRLPAAEFVDYFQKKNLDPAAMANQVGVTNLEEAVTAGSDLEIPRANFFGKLDPEHQAGLLPDVVDPATDLTAKQTEAGRSELDEWAKGGGVEKLAAELAQADEETQASPEWQRAYTDLKQRYVDAGDAEPVAEQYATMNANAFSYFSRESGQTLDEVMKLHAPKVVAAEAPGDEDANAAPVQFQEAQGENGESLPKRGWFRMLPNGAAEIGKTKIADFSTFIHEPAHAYLELFRTMSQREDASEQLKADFATISKALGTTPEEVHKNGFTTAQHELWARMNELYVREGKAPNAAMQRVFHYFSVWLHRIYRQAKSLGVEMSDEVHGVMDRLYAGESAVDRAVQDAGERRLFATPEEAGWTEAEFRDYAEKNGVAVDEARAQVLHEMNDAAERERTQAWREEQGNVRDAVTQQIDAMPEYTAIRSLRRGKLDDGTELTLNREALVSQFGDERVKALNQLHRGIYRNEGGTDADTAAELFGFRSGEEMLQALEAAPRRSAAITAATRDYLVNKYGDVRYDGSLNDRARFALENDERAGNIYREMRALRAKLARLEKRTADAKAAMAAITIEPLEHYQEAARQMIDQKAIADLQPHRYLDASRKYSREAFDALRKGNVRKAAEAKNKELLNHFLFREASTARDYVEKFEKYVQRAVQSKGIQQRLALAGSDFREQFNWLLARYRMGPLTSKPERSLREWAEEMYGAGNEPAIAPGILNEGRSADYRSVPMSEVRDLHDALVNIRHLAQREFKMFVQGKQVAFGEARAAMVNAARDNLKVKPETIFEENRSLADRAMDVTRNADALLVRMERMVEWLDGGKSGPWHDNLWNLAADAQGDEYALQHEITKRVTDALADMPHEMRRRLWTEKVSVEGIPEPLTRRRMLSIAFNIGNEGNLDRLQKTFDHFGWDREAIRRIGGMLTHEEWQFVQKAWDSLKPLGERMQEMEKRLTGLPPAMVKVSPFKVALDDGTEMDLAGGYFPIVMDPRFSQRAIEQDSRETAQNAMQSGYVRATTSRGYTKERTGFGGPLLLDYERVMTSHVAKVVKDLSHREFMLSSQRLLLDTEVRKTLRETLGPAYERQFMPWLRTIINDRNGSVDQGLGFISDAMQTLRSNIVAASIGFKASTLMLQITHAPRMMLYAKPSSLAQALGDFLAHPIRETHEIHQLSPNEMRYRGDSLDRDVRAVLQRPSYKNGYERKIAVAARFSLATVDHVLSHVLWRAAYRDGLEKYSDLSLAEAEKKAIYEADSAVRLGLNSQAAKDLPAIMRNNDFNKMITVLYGFHNGVYNQLRDSFHQASYDHSLVKLTYAAVLTAILPAVLGDLVTGQKPKDGENSGLWAAQRALLFSADTIPLVSDVAQYLDRGRDLQFTPLESVMQQGAKAAMEATSDKDEKDWMGIGLNAGGAAGELLGWPGSQQFVKTLRYWHRVEEGRVENPNWWNAIVGGGR